MTDDIKDERARGLKLRDFASSLNAITVGPTRGANHHEPIDWHGLDEDEQPEYKNRSIPQRPRLHIRYPNGLFFMLLPYIEPEHGWLVRDKWILPADPVARTRQPTVVSTHEMTERMKKHGCNVRVLND